MKAIISLFLVLSLFLSSCNLEPIYKRPCMPMPAQWRLATNEESTSVNIEWWQELGDPILDALILQALQNNKELKVAAWRVCEFYAHYKIVNSQLYPQINLEGSAFRERYPDQTSFLPFGFDPIQSQYRYAFNLDYEIDFWGKIRSLSHAAFAELLGSVENRRNVVLTLVASVARTYIFLRQLDLELEIALNTLADRKEYLRLAKLRYEGGLTSEIEVMQAISVLEETEAVVISLQKRIPMEENLLSILLGTSPTCIIRGKSLYELHVIPYIPTGLPCELLCRRPDILEAESHLIAANANIGAARALFFPALSLTGLFGGESFQLSKLFSKSSRAWAIGGSFVQQIFTGGRLTGQLNLTIAEKQAMLYQYEQTILNAFKEVNDALISHQQAQKLVIIERRRVAAEAQYLHLAWLRYYNGETDYLTVLDAERRFFDSQINLAQAQGSTLLSLVEIYKTLGGGWVLQADRCLR